METVRGSCPTCTSPVHLLWLFSLAHAAIGGFVSYNSDILDLYGRVGLGTTVVVLP